jgi:hypothetical protein
MKTYIYTYRRIKNDRNGNPKHWVTVYRMKNNVPILISEETEVGYHSVDDMVCQIISQTEKLTFLDRDLKEMGKSFKEFYMGRRNMACMTSGMTYNPASWRYHQKRIKLFRV